MLVTSSRFELELASKIFLVAVQKRSFVSLIKYILNPTPSHTRQTHRRTAMDYRQRRRHPQIPVDLQRR